MRAPDVGRRLLAGLAVLILSAGCAAAASPTPTPAPASAIPTVSAATVTPTPIPTAAPAPTPSPMATGYGPATVVTGTSACPSIDFGTITTDAKGVQHGRIGKIACTHTVNDPRVSGTYEATWNVDWWGTADHSSGALVQWGTARLVNAGGAWVGRYTGVYSSERGDIISTWYAGTGGYAGLAYFTVETGMGPWTIQGQLFPGNPPTP